MIRPPSVLQMMFVPHIVKLTPRIDHCIVDMGHLSTAL
jgi:hypothetical protein